MTDHLRSRARTNYERLWTDAAAVYRVTEDAASGDFGHNLTFTLLDIEPANYWAVSGSEALMLEALQVKASLVVTMRWDADVTEHDQIVLTDGETGAIHHLEINWVQRGSGDIGLRLACIEYPLSPA